MSRKLIPVIALLAVSAQPTLAAKKFSKQDIYDGTCLLLYADVLGSLADDDHEKRMGVSSIVAYYVGKLRARNANLSLKTLLTPDFAAKAMAADQKTRKACADESVGMGNDLSEAGNILVAASAE